MTRDEAIKRVRPYCAATGDWAVPGSLVDSLIALDILKTEESADPVRTRAISCLRELPVAVHTVMPSTKPHLEGCATAKLSGMGAIEILAALEFAGLTVAASITR